MRDARGRFWPRTALLGGLAVIGAVHPGCSCSDDDGTSGGTTGTTTTTTTGGTGGMGGAGGSGAEGGAGGTGGAGGGGGPTFQVSQTAEAFAFDVTPGPQANYLYFTGMNSLGAMGVFKAAINGGDIAPMATGEPFVAPFGIATSADGLRILVTDLGAGDPATGADAGRIFAVSSMGAVTVVQGGDGTRPRGIETYTDAQGAEKIVFTGVDPADGQPGVFELPVDGGALTVIAKGSPFADPSGVAVAPTGEVYVCDTVANADKTATVFVVQEGIVNEAATGIHAGYPCGIALTMDGSRLLVAGKGALKGTDEVRVVDVATQATSTITTLIEQHNEPAGLHRSKGSDVFGFADSKAQGAGLLFVIKQ